SPTLWDVAHGPPDPAPDYHYEEEADVLALQRLLNTGDPTDDPDGRLAALAREIDVDALIERARTLLREGPITTDLDARDRASREEEPAA
ncbi:MAG: hypothetical protein ACODAE_07575, partial [Gemmatimonadota bacterium]